MATSNLGALNNFLFSTAGGDDTPPTQFTQFIDDCGPQGAKKGKYSQVKAQRKNSRSVLTQQPRFVSFVYCIVHGISSMCNPPGENSAVMITLNYWNSVLSCAKYRTTLQIPSQNMWFEGMESNQINKINLGERSHSQREREGERERTSTVILNSYHCLRVGRMGA